MARYGPEYVGRRYRRWEDTGFRSRASDYHGGGWGPRYRRRPYDVSRPGDGGYYGMEPRPRRGQEYLLEYVPGGRRPPQEGPAYGRRGDAATRRRAQRYGYEPEREIGPWRGPERRRRPRRRVRRWGEWPYDREYGW